MKSHQIKDIEVIFYIHYEVIMSLNIVTNENAKRSCCIIKKIISLGYKTISDNINHLPTSCNGRSISIKSIPVMFTSLGEVTIVLQNNFLLSYQLI